MLALVLGVLLVGVVLVIVVVLVILEILLVVVVLEIVVVAEILVFWAFHHQPEILAILKILIIELLVIHGLVLGRTSLN